jgi:hypothetical protein
MSIKSNAEIIRDEQVLRANTARRVGGTLVDIADDLIAKQAAIEANTAKVGISNNAQTIAGIKTFSSTVIAPTVLINKSVDNGTDKLQVNGSALIAGAFRIDSSDKAVFLNGINSILMQTQYSNTRLLSAGKDVASFLNSYKGFPMFINSNATINDGNGNVIIFSSTNNGIDKLQVNGSVIVTTLKTSSFTVATLPNPPAQGLGAIAHVTDALNPTYLGTLTGGGTVKCPVFYNGTNWISA